MLRWADEDSSGVAFDSFAGFELPNGADLGIAARCMIGRGSVTAAPKAASHRPPPYLECIRRYTAGEHWHAHEVLEDLWRATSDPERRRFYQGIIQLAAAFVHAERGNMRGVQRLLAKAAAKLDAVSSPYLGIDVAGLLRAMAAAGREARAAEADPQRSFDWRCKPRLSLMAE